MMPSSTTPSSPLDAASLPQHVEQHSDLEHVAPPTEVYPYYSPVQYEKNVAVNAEALPLPPPAASERRIAGLKPWAFWCLVAAVVVIVIAGSVGGSVGGAASMKTNQQADKSAASTSSPTTTAASSSSSSSPSSATGTPSSTSTSKATSTPQTGVSFDCPSSDSTYFTPEAPGGGTGSNRFLKRCGVNVDGDILMGAFVTSFDTCVALCSNWNYMQGGDKGGRNCTSVDFNPQGIPPNNCWARNGTTFTPRQEPGGGALLK